LAEFLDSREVRNFLKLYLLPDGIHDFDEFNGIPIIFGKIFFE
jgi:hypothetical protein